MNGMHEFFRRTTQNLQHDLRVASFDQERFDVDYFDPFLQTSADSATRAERAERLRAASRKLEDRT
ncbi:MAG: hypothetical protein NUV72_08540 [Bauldia sp.]|nr:hypothetical protein [Bauldia sp.]